VVRTSAGYAHYKANHGKPGAGQKAGVKFRGYYREHQQELFKAEGGASRPLPESRGTMFG
jgi:hypothetical protein